MRRHLIAEWPTDAAATRARHRRRPARPRWLRSVPKRDGGSAGRQFADERDKVIRNSLLLMISLALMGGFGFLFWIVVARLYTPAQVGAASTLIAAVVLIAFLSLAGLDVMVVRFLAKSQRRDELVTTCLCIVAGMAAVLSAAYVQVVPHYTRELAFVGENLLFAAAFTAICVLSAIDLFSNAVFVAFRKPEFNVLTDGLVQSFFKLVSPFLLVGVGTYGIVLSTGVGYAMAVAASLLLMKRALSMRWTWPRGGLAFRELGRFSSSAYLAQVLNLAPMQLLPMIVLKSLGPVQAAAFFMAFQIANLVYLIGFSVSQTMYSECSHNSENLMPLIVKSARLLGILLVPAVSVLFVFGGYVLHMIGPDYAEHGLEVLRILLLGAFAVGVSAMTNSLLKVLARMRLLIAANAASCLVILGMAQIVATRGLDWVAGAWIVGTLCAAAIGLTPLIFARLQTSRTAGAMSARPPTEHPLRAKENQP
jgi:O-antigen/teichoic acid export membrane protein